MYCNNCGIEGHTYFQCRNPIMSYGVIIFKKENDIIKILMINRKDSLCYIDFLRGKYNLHDIDYLLHLCNHFSISEKENIIRYTFDELWRKLWVLEDKNIKSHIKNEYKKGKDKFEKLKKGIVINNELINLQYLHDNIKTNYETTEWEFPKGRRNENEKNKVCAIREFHEETNISDKDYCLFKNIIPISEEYRGENNIRYKHIYYLGILLNNDIELSIDSSNIHQINEVRDIQWFTKEESYQKIRNYNKTKYEIIDKVFHFANEYTKDLQLY